MADETETVRVFVIAGEDCPMPDVAGLDMSERRVMFELAGCVQEDFLQGEDETDDEHEARVLGLTRHPGFMESLMHIAYQRQHPELKRVKVQQVIDKTRFTDAVAKWADEDDAGPPEMTSPTTPDVSSQPSSDSRNGRSGESSTNSSDEPEGRPGSIGTPVLVMSSPATPAATLGSYGQPI